MRLLFALIVLFHGLIHLMGFAKAFHLAEVPQLGGSFSKSAGVLWLLTALLFAASMFLFFLKKDEWWMLAAAAVLLSQILIFTQWNDAKFGTIANLIALAGVATGYGAWQFNRMVRTETAVFAAAPLPAPVPLTREMLAPLPPVVQHWLERCDVVGKDVIHKVHLRQAGEMRTKPDAGWLAFEAEQYNTVDNPGFIWTTQIEMMPAVYLAGRDKYQDCHGHMLIRLLSLFPVADAKGPETDQGTLLRNLAEICWFPTAALSDYIRWESLDALSARATMTCGGTSASGIFRFNADGDMTGFEAQRYYNRKEGPTLETWVVENKDWKTMNGIRIPYKSEITWKLKTGDFTWLKLEITDIEYNKP
jgi:hypothetical protein